MFFDTQKSIQESVSNYGILALSKILVQVLHLVTIAVIIRKLGPDLYGKMSVFLMITQALYLITSGWTSAGYTRFSILHETQNKSISEVFWTRTLVVGVLCVLSGLTLVVCKKFILQYLELPLPVIYIAFFHLLSLVSTDYTKEIAQICTRFKQLAVINTIERILILVMIILWGEEIFDILIFIIIGTIICRLYYMFSVKTTLYYPIVISFRLLSRILKFSYPLFFVSLGGFIFGYVDIAVIKHFAEFKAVGVYALAYNGFGAIEAGILLIPTILTPIMVSLAANNRNDVVQKFINKIIPQISCVWSYIFVFICPTAIIIIPAVFGIEFVQSVNIFLVLLLCLNLSVMNALCISIFIGYDMVFRMSVINLVASFINLILDILLVPQIGIYGAALGTAISYFIITYSYCYLLKSRFSVDFYRFAFLLIIPLHVIIFITFNNWSVYLVTSIISMLLIFLISRRALIFSSEDSALYQSLNLPYFLKNTLTRICQYYG